MNAGRKYYFYTGLACLLGLAILSIIFFKERIAFSDTAYQAVYLLIEQRPFVNWVRIGSVITQAMPLMAIWLHAGLYTVMVLHSLSFIVFFTAIYLLAYRFSKTTLLFFIIPLYLVLITTEVFYWPQSELQQGMLWLCLYAVLIFEKKWHKAALWQFLSIHFLCILWIQFFHPLIFFPLIFLVIYYYGSRPQLFSEKAFYHLMLCGIAFGIRDVVGMMDPYEKSKLNIGGAMKNNLPHFFSLGSVHAFVHKLPSSYFIYTLFLAVSLLWLTANRKYIKALALSIFSAGYWILIMVSSPQDTRFYTENMLLPLGFMVALAVAADIIPAIRARYIPLVFFVAIIIRLAFIYHAHRDYTAHFSIYRQYFDYIKKNKLTGLFVDERLVDRQRAISTWGSGYESILISSLVSPDSCRVVQIDPEPHHYNWAIDNDTSLITIYGVWHQSQLPQRYFRLSGGKYEMLIKQP